jgi:hypothetical protein
LIHKKSMIKKMPKVMKVKNNTKITTLILMRMKYDFIDFIA